MGTLYEKPIQHSREPGMIHWEECKDLPTLADSSDDRLPTDEEFMDLFPDAYDPSDSSSAVLTGRAIASKFSEKKWKRNAYEAICLKHEAEGNIVSLSLGPGRPTYRARPHVMDQFLNQFPKLKRQ